MSDDNGLLEENEGVNPVLNDPDAIFPYSIGKYIAEKFHSATCINSDMHPRRQRQRLHPGRGQEPVRL